MPPEEQSTEQTPEVIQQTPSENQNPTPTPQSPSTDKTGQLLYLSVLQEKNRELEELRRKLDEKERSPVPPVPFSQQQEQQYFEKPMTTTRELVASEIDRAMAPVYDFMKGFQRNDAYSLAKQRAKQNQLLGPLLIENEQYIDQMMQGIEPTDANLTAAIFQAKGLASAGMFGQNNTITPQQPQSPMLPSFNPNNPAPQNNQQQQLVTPPHLRPSAPPAPNFNPAPVQRPLTENERRLIREQGWKEEEYRAAQGEGALLIEPPTNQPKRG